MRYFKKIAGERVYLSPINVEDAEKYTEWINDLKQLCTFHKIWGDLKKFSYSNLTLS